MVADSKTPIRLLLFSFLFIHAMAASPFSDLFVTISPNVPVAQGKETLDGIRQWVTAGADTLHKATKHRRYIRNVDFLLPESWTDEHLQSEEDDQPYTIRSSNEYIFEDGHIRVASANPLYGHSPYTTQNGACGQPADDDFVHVTPEYVMRNNDTSMKDQIGKPGNVFVHEVSKLLFGVYDEHGYPGDNRYPLFYHDDVVKKDNSTVTEIRLNMNTNVPLAGERKDLHSGQSCQISPESGLPDSNCVFSVDAEADDNSNVQSSFLAAPFIDSVRYFSGQNQKSKHDPTLPNKQNDLCRKKSSWAVIEPQLDGNVNHKPPETSFHYLRPQAPRVVLVLDVSVAALCPSCSPDDDPEYDSAAGQKLDLFKLAAFDWVSHDLKDGTQLAVITFGEEPEVLFGKNLVTINEETRPKIIETMTHKIQFKTGNNCQGEAVKKAKDVLGKVGGIIIFLTSGKHNCGTSKPISELDFSEDPIRAIALPFGPDATDDLEILAKQTNGGEFYIPTDATVEHVLYGLQGALSFQSSSSNDDKEFVISSPSFLQPGGVKSRPTATGTTTFVIDRTAGKNVRLVTDYSISPEAGPSLEEGQTLAVLTLTPPAEAAEGEQESIMFIRREIRLDPFKPLTDVWTFGALSPGTYVLHWELKTNFQSFETVVSSKPVKEDIPPFGASCWTNAEIGGFKVSEATRVAIMARVAQANEPILGAKVMAFIEGETMTSRLELLDNGSGADVTAGDGIYSRFISQFGRTGRYNVRCSVSGSADNDKTVVHVMADDADADRSNSREPSAAWPVCCGKDARRADDHFISTGDFSRLMVAGSFNIVNDKDEWQDLFGPLPANDLKATMDLENGAIELTFTSPGESLDSGTPMKYDIGFHAFAAQEDDLEMAWLDSTMLLSDSQPLSPPAMGGQPVVLRVNASNFDFGSHYLFQLTTTDYQSKTSSSNTADLFLVRVATLEPFSEEKTGLNGGEITAIILGAILGVFLIVVVAYLILNRGGPGRDENDESSMEDGRDHGKDMEMSSKM